MMRLRITLLVACLSSCKAYQPPPSWVGREDCHFRASERSEDFTASELVSKIRREEGKDFFIVISPGSAKEISNELSACHIDLDACRNK